MRRSSRGGDSDYMDDPRIRRERWDRDRFERMKRGRGGGGSSVAGDSHAGRRGDDDSEHFRFEEHERFPGGRRDVDIREDRQHRGPMVIEREHFHEDERFDRPARTRTDILHEPTPSEVANQALAPYRRQPHADKDINVDINIRESRAPARPARPGYVRRQSSLDTFDRRPVPRYAAIERYETREYRPPANVPIPLPIRERHRSPPRRYRDEEDFEDVRFEERSGRGREREEFREIEVHKSKSRVRKSKSDAKSTRSSSSSSSEEEQLARATWGKRGKTRLPKRLVKKQAIIDLGYPFVEEDDFIVITRALEKEHIDEVIKISENYQEEKLTYVYEDKSSEVQAPPPPPPPAAAIPPPQEFYAAPPPQEFYAVPPPVVMHNPPAPSHHAPSHYAPTERPPSPSIHEHERYVEIERSNNVRGFATSFAPHERQLMRRRSERDIREEIRSLEAERRMLKYERDGELEIIETRPAKREVIRVDKDRKVRKDAKLIAAMMSTLT